MNKLVAAFILLAAGSTAFAEPASVARSSYVAGATQSACIQATYLSKIVVGEATSGGNVMLYNSSWTHLSSQIISSATLATVGSVDFDNAQVNGICYTADTPTNGFTVIYRK